MKKPNNTEKKITLLELFEEWEWIDSATEIEQQLVPEQPKRSRPIKIATFVPYEHSGYLVCPHCQAKYTQHGNDGLINPSCSPYWEEMREEKWNCPGCGKRFALPANPFITK